MMTCSAPGLASAHSLFAEIVGECAIVRELQRPPSMTAPVESKAFWISALMSPTSNRTPFMSTACCGSGTIIAAGAQAWHVPHQVAIPSTPSAPCSSVLPSPSLSMPSCISPPPWKFLLCHFAAGPAQL